MFSSKASSGFSLSSPKGFFPASSGIQSQNSFRVEGAAKSSLPGVLPPASGIAGCKKTAQIESCKAVAVLYARNNSIYKKIPSCDVFDLARDARTYSGQMSVVAHPLCRLWGRLRQFSTAPVVEKHLALHAVVMVRRNGGVLEHPAWSTLWSAAGLPLPGERDDFGGFTYPILQSWFGHKAPKATWLYIVGIEPFELPPVSFQLGIPAGRVCATGSMKVREGTPIDLAYWLLEVAARVPAPVVPSLPIKNAALSPGDIVDTKSLLPAGFEPYDLKGISNEHPFQHSTFRITARLTSSTRDMFAFAVSSNGGSSSYLSSLDLVKAGYSVIAINDCSVKLVYKAVEFFVTCVDSAARPMQFQPVNLAQGLPTN